MPIEIFDVEQGSAEWIQLRLGLPTASEFATIMALGKNGGESVTRRLYMNQLAGEIVTGMPSDGAYTNRHLVRGKEKEPEAAEAYAFINGIDLRTIGFIKNGDVGASPDRLIGNDGGVEFKSGLAHVVIDAMRRDKIPPEHIAQLQGSIWVCEREWWDLAIYADGLPLFQKRAFRDEAYIATLKTAVAQFQEHLQQVVAYVREYG